MKTKFKRIFVTMLISIFAVSSVFAFGCSNSASKFNGNYEEATSEQIQTYSEQIASSEDGGVLSVTDGYLVELKSVFGNYTLNATYKTGKVNGVPNLSVEISASSSGASVKATLYYDGNYAFAKLSAGGNTVKIKERIDLEEFMDEFMEVPEIDFQEIYNELIRNYQNELTILREETEDEIKIKFELLKGTEIDNVIYSNYQNVFLFDKAFNIKGVMLKSKGEYNGIKEDSTLIITEYTGEIKMPSDASDYLEMEIPEF